MERGFLVRAWVLGRKIARLRLPLYGANVCYFLVLSIFPGLLLVLSSLRYSDLSAMDLIVFLESLVPDALMPGVERLVVNTYYNSTGAVVSVSALAALWSASRGVYGLIMGLNRVYGVRENRGYFRTRIISVGYSVVLLVVLVLTLVLHVFGGDLVRYLENSPGFWIKMVDLRLVLLLLAQTMVFTLIYMVLPNRPNGFRDSVPGAVAAALGWQSFSKLFSIYVVHFSDYASIYGSVYAMALGMLWLYCCTLILLCGGAVNRFLVQRKEG